MNTLCSKKNLLRRQVSAVALSMALFGAAAPVRADTQPVERTLPAQSVQVDMVRRAVSVADQLQLAGAKFETGPNESLEIVLADGGSIALGPNSRVIISEFAYDPTTQKGALRLNVEKGAARIMGGRGNADSPIVIDTPNGGASLLNGGAFVAADGVSTRFVLLLGGLLTLTGGTPIDKPGFEQSMRGGAIEGAAKRQNAKQAFADSLLVNPGLAATAGTQTSESTAAQTTEDEAQDEGDRRQSTDQPPSVFNPDNDFGAGGPGEGIDFAGGAGGERDNIRNVNRGDANYGLFLGAVLNQSQPATNAALIATPALERRFNITSGTDTAADRYSYVPTGAASEVLDDDAGDLRLALLGAPDPAAKAAACIGTDSSGGGNTDRCDGSSTAETRFEALVDFLLSRATELKLVTTRADGVNLVGVVGPTQQTDDNTFSFRQAYSIPSSVPGWSFGDPASDGIMSPVISGSKITFEAPEGLPDPFDPNQSQSFSPVTPAPIDFRILKTGYADAAASSAGALVGVFRRADNNFVYIEGRDLIEPGNTIGDTIVYAQGAFTGAAPASGRIDSFAVTRGLTPTDWDGGPQEFRSFVPEAGSFDGKAYFSTPLLAAYSGAGSSAGLLHADFAMTDTGRASSISATFGRLTYASNGQATISGGRTIGSQRENAGSTQISASLFASASGGGNPAPGIGTDVAGYLVLENVDAAGAVSRAGTVEGTVQAIGSSDTSNYGYLRLATATSTASRAVGSSRMSGFIAGVSEAESAAGQSSNLQRLSGTVTITPDAANSAVSATLTLANGGPSPIELGGTTNSAYIDGARFAAASGTGDSHAAVLLSGPTVLGGLPEAVQASIKSNDRFEDPTNGHFKNDGQFKYLQWGFFFGDLIKAGARNHTHLSTWVTAPIANLADYRKAGTVTYSGFALGNVVEGAATRFAGGTFSQEWNLDRGTGSMDLTFDGRSYEDTAGLRMGAGSLDYQGQLRGASSAASIGSVTGMLAGEALNGNPSASIGEFNIQNSGYSAIGTFGGELNKVNGQPIN